TIYAAGLAFPNAIQNRVEWLLLLPRGKTAADAMPQHKPFDATLDGVREGQSGRLDCARFGHAPTVLRRAKSRPHAEPKHIEPARLVRRTTQAPMGDGDQRVGKTPNGGKRPASFAMSEHLLEMSDEPLGQDVFAGCFEHG